MGVSGRRGGTRARPSRFLRLGFAVATTENPHPVFRGSRLGGFQGVNMGVSPAADTPAGWQECLGESELLGGALFQTCGLADYSLPSSGRYFTDPGPWQATCEWWGREGGGRADQMACGEAAPASRFLPPGRAPPAAWPRMPRGVNKAGGTPQGTLSVRHWSALTPRDLIVLKLLLY